MHLSGQIPAENAFGTLSSLKLRLPSIQCFIQPSVWSEQQEEEKGSLPLLSDFPSFLSTFQLPIPLDSNGKSQQSWRLRNPFSLFHQGIYGHAGGCITQKYFLSRQKRAGAFVSWHTPGSSTCKNISSHMKGSHPTSHLLPKWEVLGLGGLNPPSHN